jgi:elongation factor P--(R)-beta-lysine ligase
MNLEWRPSAGIEALRRRAEVLGCIRAFFAERGVMEVETPALAACGATDPHLDSFCTHYSGPGATADGAAYLQTSPEFAMKRLLAAGSGPIYQICKAFRNGESGRYHNPEFTMLEWYRPGFNYRALMAEVDDLVRLVLNTPAAARLSYAAVFEQHLQLDPHSASAARLRACGAGHGLVVSETVGDDRDAWLTLLWTHLIEPYLGDGGHPLFVFDYPVSQAMLARIRPGSPAVAERFEVYVDGVELANGFQELQDSAEQRHRFEENCRRRRAEGMLEMDMDKRLLAALANGLPFCSGVALGLDRLLMLKTDAGELKEVLAFPFDRA